MTDKNRPDVFEEIELPPRETWEGGLVQAESIATKFLHSYDKNHKVIEILTEQRGDAHAPTIEELKLSLSLLVCRRLLIEARADLMFNTVAVTKARHMLMGHHGLPKAERERIVSALAIKEGVGVVLSRSWRVMEQGLKRWMNPKFWNDNKNPCDEARTLFLAIQGIKEVGPVEHGNNGKEEGQDQAKGGGERGPSRLEKACGEAGGSGQAEQRATPEEDQGSLAPAEGAGRGRGSPGSEDEGVQGVQEAPGRQDQGEEGQDRHDPQGA